MNARMFVIVLATGVFMAVWNGDQRAMDVKVAQQPPARNIVSSRMAANMLQVAAVEVRTKVTPRLVTPSLVTADAEPKPELEAEAVREDSDAAALAEMLTAAENDNVCRVPPEGASGKFESTPVMTSETDVLPQSIPTFTSVDDVIVFGIPAEEPVEVSVSIEPCPTDSAVLNTPLENTDESVIAPESDVSDESDESDDAHELVAVEPDASPSAFAAIADTEADVTASQNPDFSGIDLLMVTLDRLFSALSSDVDEPAADLSVAGTEEAVAVTHPDDVPPPKEAMLPIIPVPRDLPAGTWTVLSQSGETLTITIERSTPGPTSADHFCVRSAPDGDRWCFVRAAEPTPPLEPMLTSEPTLTVEPPLTVEPTAPAAPAAPPRRVSTEFFSPAETQ